MVRNIIKVIWEDTVENYSAAKEREIKKYLSNKYHTEKVSLIFRAIGNNKNVDVTAENISGDLVINTEYQHKLMQAYLKERNLDMNWNYLLKLDTTVNSTLDGYEKIGQRFKRFVIKKVEFSNFLSFSPEKHKFDLKGHNGIVTVQSIPANYGGKTVFTVDLLLFLFFNTTTRTKTAEEIFNLYSKSDEVIARGELEIDGSDYIIERTIKRVKKRDGSYNVTTSLDFYQIFDGQNIMKLNGEQRAATDQIIKDYIGTKEDFLLTIVTTSNNLEDLIETKPTERGQILTRFIGIDFFREKERIAKQNYQDWFDKTKLKTHTPESIVASNKELAENIDSLEKQITIAELEIETLTEEFNKKTKEKEDKLRLVMEIDKELYQVDEDRVVTSIADLNKSIEAFNATITEQRKNLKVPSKVFDVDEYQTLTVNLKDERVIESELITKISTLSSFMSNLSTVSECGMCGKTVLNDETTRSIKKNQNDTHEANDKLLKVRKTIDNLEAKILAMNQIRDEWTTYDKAVLSVDKNELDMQRYITSRDRGNDLLIRYRNNKKAIDLNKQIETAVGVLTHQINQLNELIMDQKVLLANWTDEKAAMLAKIDDNIAIMDQIKKEAVFQKHFQVYIEMFSKNGIGKMVLATMIPLINAYLSQILSDVSEFTLTLDLNDKNMVEFNMVDQSENIVKPLSAGSGFEKTVASIALRCALSKICSLPKPNIIVFDEVFGKVANDNLDKMAYLFERLKEFFDVIILISHNPMVHEWGDTKLVITKINNMSMLRSGSDD